MGRRYLAFIRDDVVIKQIPTRFTDDEAIDIDDLLRDVGLLKNNEEVATVEALPNVERACGNPECGVSTGICGSLTFGWGVLDDYGYWEHPCKVCGVLQDEPHED